MQTGSARAIDARSTSLQVASALDIDGDEAELVARLRYLGAQGDLAATELGYADAVAGLLAHASPEVVAAAAEALGNMGAVAAARYIDSVAGALDSQSSKVRQSAAYALGQLGEASKKHGSQLVDVIRRAGQGDDEEATKVIALQALGAIRASSGIEVAATLLEDPSPQVQAAACLALGGLGATSAAGAVAAKLGVEGVRCAAIRALAELGPEASRPHAGEIVARGVADPDMQTRGEAVAALSLLDAADAQAVVGELSKLLKSQEPAVRASAALGLGSVGAGGVAPDGALAALAELLEDSAEDLTWMPLQVGGGACREPMAMRKPRCAALVSLGSLRAESYAGAIAGLLEDEDWEVRFCALEALGCMDARDKADKVAALLDDDTYPVRAKACAVLGVLGAEQEVDKMSEMLQDSAQTVRTEAIIALAGMGEAAQQYSAEVAKLLGDSSNNVRAAAVRTLVGFGDVGRPYAGVIAKLLYDPQPEVRAEVCRALGAMGSHGAAFAEDVAGALEDPSGETRAAAAEALGRMGAEAAPFAAQIRQLAADPDPAVVRAAARALGGGEELLSLQQDPLKAPEAEMTE